MINSKVLIVVTAYRPPNRDLVYMQNLCQLISEIHSKYKNAVIWITGDFNLPDINWSLNSVTSNSYPLDISTLLIDEFNSGGFIQMVNKPTRGNNILDLFATNRPSLVEHTKVIPGISDHEIVSVELTLSVTVNKPKVHNVYLWNRADFQDINDVIIQFSNTFLSDNSVDTPVQELWDSFKTMCQKCLELVPCKSLSSSIKYPWITTQIKRLSNKKQRLYNRTRYSGLQSDCLAYYELKKSVQHECRKAHDTYVADLLTSNNGHINKRFWTYINGKRNEQCHRRRSRTGWSGHGLTTFQ